MLLGTAIGERKINCCGRGFAFEPESRLLCELLFNPFDNGGILGSLFSSQRSHKMDEIGGAIYRVRPEVMNKFMSCVPHSKTNSSKLAINPSKDVEEFISRVDGIWHHNVKFDGTEYWNVERDSPHVLEYEADPLPSDSLFRPDIIYLKMGKNQQSQTNKELIEAV